MSEQPTTDQKLAALRASAEKHLAFYGHNRVGYGVDAEYLLTLVECAEALPEVIRISDRKHDAWDRAKAALAKLESL